MSYSIINTDIVKIEADIIVNASNGIGFMGGIIGKYFKLPGVAEAIHYATRGKVEKESKKKCRRIKFIPRIFCGYKPSDIFVTNSYDLNCKYILHAVTMRYPGLRTDLKTVELLLFKIVEESRKLKANTVAIPLLGTGTGGLSEEKVLNLYENYFKNINDIEIKICRI